MPVFVRDSGPGPRRLRWSPRLCGHLVAFIGYQMVDLYPTGMLVEWGVIGLVEMTLASIVGAWIYREE